QLRQVGIRTMNATQRTQAERHGVDVLDMRAWVPGRRSALAAPVYVSIDLDAFDPAFAPGVGHREPGGLTVREVLTVLQGLPVPIVGADVVEFNPQQDAGGAGGVTAAVCAKLVKELAGKMIADRKSTRLNSSHVAISYAVFCLKKKRRMCRQRRRGAGAM